MKPPFDKTLNCSSIYPYINSKLQAQQLVNQYRQKLPISMVYCPPMYGAGDKHNHTGILFKLLFKKLLQVAPPGGTSVVCVKDAAEACILAAKRDSPVGNFSISSEHLTFLEIYNLILDCLQLNQKITKVLPRWLYWPAMPLAYLADQFGNDSQFCPYLIRNAFGFRYFDSQATQLALGWKPKTSIKTAIH